MVLDATRQSKWDPVYEGPYTVVSQHEGGAYFLKDITGKIDSRRFTIDLLKSIPAIAADGTPSGGGSKTRELATEEAPNDHYEVERIVDHAEKEDHQGYQYLVKWKGWGTEDNTWEPEESFDGEAAIKRYWASKGQKNAPSLVPQAKATKGSATRFSSRKRKKP